MFQTISPNPAAPPPDPAPNPQPAAPKATENTVLIEEAIKGGQHTQMTGFSVSDLPKQPGSSSAPGSSVALGGLVQGKVMVELVDALIPALIVLLFRKMRIDAKKTQFQLTQGEKNTLAPIVEACLNSINLDFSNPWTTLGVSMLIIYGGKAIEVGGVQWIDKKAAEGQPAKEKSQGPAPTKTSNPLMNSGAGSARPPQPNPPKPSTNNDTFTDIQVSQSSGQLPQWTEEDLRRVCRWGRYNREKGLAWLQRNWEKSGGILPDKWNKPIPK